MPGIVPGPGRSCAQRAPRGRTPCQRDGRSGRERLISVRHRPWQMTREQSRSHGGAMTKDVAMTELDRMARRWAERFEAHSPPDGRVDRRRGQRLAEIRVKQEEEFMLIKAMSCQLRGSRVERADRRGLRHRGGFGLHRRDDHLVNLFPGVGARARQVAIGRTCEDDGRVTFAPQLLDVRRRVLDVESAPTADLSARKHRVPVRDVMAVQPVHRLLHRGAVEVLDQQAVRDDSDADAHVRQAPEHLRRPRHGPEDAEQIALQDRELVQLRIAAGRLRDAPLGQIPEYFAAERLLVTPSHSAAMGRSPA